MEEEAGQGESEEDDAEEPQINSVEAARMNLKKKQTLAKKSGKKD